MLRQSSSQLRLLLGISVQVTAELLLRFAVQIAAELLAKTGSGSLS